MVHIAAPRSTKASDLNSLHGQKAKLRLPQSISMMVERAGLNLTTIMSTRSAI
jgi:hypothetical protein